MTNLYRFPSLQFRRKQWISSVFQTEIDEAIEENLARVGKICRNHFSEWCFTSSLKVRLTFGAVPCLTASPFAANTPSPLLPEHVLKPHDNMKRIGTVCEIRVAGAAGKDLKTIEVPTEEIYRAVRSLQNGQMNTVCALEVVSTGGRTVRTMDIPTEEVYKDVTHLQNSTLKKIKLEPEESFSESYPKILTSGNETTSSEINSSSEPLIIPLDISTSVQSDVRPPSSTDCVEVPSAACVESLGESVQNEEDADSDSGSNEISSDEVELSSAAPVEKSCSGETALYKLSNTISLKEQVLRAVLHTEKLKQKAEQIRIEYEQCRLEREKLELWKLKKECRQLGYEVEEST